MVSPGLLTSGPTTGRCQPAANCAGPQMMATPPLLRVSAFGGKTVIEWRCEESPLSTLSGRSRPPWPSRIEGSVPNRLDQRKNPAVVLARIFARRG